MRAELKSAPVAYLGALCASGALVLAVFYHGPQIPLLAGAQFLLVAWLAFSVAASYREGIRLPLTPLSISLTLFWAWLGVSILWSKVPTTSIVTFWWVGSLALAFWCYTLARQRERVWWYVARFVLAGALVLCGYALVQLFAWGLPPRSTFVNIHSFAALMMLIALPLSARFLLEVHQRANSTVLCVIGGSLFVLFFTIAVTEGRGTTLSLMLGAAVLTALVWRMTRARPLLFLWSLLIGAYLSAYLFLHGGLTGGRLATLADPADAGSPRFLIWHGSWKLLMEDPWWGIGLGTYYLAWPPYRDPTDSTLGFFVHNDYLQLWIEAGLPALLLLLAVLGATVFMFVRLARTARLKPDTKLEASGFFCGLLAVAAHTFLDFNFYILPISILAGLVLGRFHDCVVTLLPSRDKVLRPLTAMQGGAYRLIVLLLALFPLLYFVALGLSDYSYKRGFQLALEGKLPEADAAFAWAERLLPSDDKVLMMRADLYRHVLTQLPKTKEPERVSLYESALALLGDAESANPYRPLIHTVRGRVIAENRDLAGGDWQRRAEQEYAHALKLDPRFFPTRIDYARVLLESGREIEAYRLLEQGLVHWYYPNQALIGYYEFTAELAKRAGAGARVAEIKKLIIDARAAIAKAVPARPVVPELLSPAAGSSV